MNKFEQVSIDDHQMSVAGNEIQWLIMVNGHIGPPTMWTDRMTDRHTLLKTLPSRNSFGGQ